MLFLWLSFGGVEDRSTVMTFCFCFGLSSPFEIFGEGDVVEKGPGVIKFAIPGPF